MIAALGAEQEVSQVASSAEIIVISIAGERLLGPLQGPMYVEAILVEVEKESTCPTPGSSPTLLVGPRQLRKGDLVGESSASLTLVWKSPLSMAIEVLEAAQAKLLVLQTRLDEAEKLALEFESLQRQAAAGPYNTLDEESLNDCRRCEEQSQCELTQMMTMIKADMMDVNEIRHFLRLAVVRARWHEVLFKACPEAAPWHDASSVADALTNWMQQHGSGPELPLIPSLKSTVEGDFGWSVEDVQPMFDGVTSASDISGIMAKTIPSYAANFMEHCEVPPLQLPMTQHHIVKLRAMLHS